MTDDGARNSELDERNLTIWRKYSLGATQHALAAEYGITQQRVGQIIQRVRELLPEQGRLDIRQALAEQIRWCTEQVVEIATAEPTPKYSNGRAVLLKNGEPAPDNAERLAAFALLAKLNERLAKLTGADAPLEVRVEDISQRASERATIAASEAAARLAAAGTRSLPGQQGTQGE